MESIPEIFVPEFIHYIGRGGSCVVWKAKCQDVIAAVKIFTKDTDFSKGWEEARLQARLRHSNILEVFGVSQKLEFRNLEDGKTYLNPGIVFQYAELGNLWSYIHKVHGKKKSHELISEAGFLSENSARLIFRSIVEALKYLEGEGLSHNDIKPENILIDKNGIVKLADFGHCCMSMGIDGKGLIGLRGTPGYAGPEVKDKNFYSGPAHDIHSLGKTLGYIVYILCKPENVNPSCKDLIKKMTSYYPSDRPLLKNLSKYSWYKGPVSTSEQLKSELENINHL